MKYLPWLQDITVIHNPITNMFMFAHRTLCFLNIQPTSTMNNVLWFKSGNIQLTIVPTTLVTTNPFQSFTLQMWFFFNFEYNGTTYGVSYVVGSIVNGTSTATTLNTTFSTRNIPFTVIFLPANSTFSFSNTTQMLLVSTGD